MMKASELVAKVIDVAKNYKTLYVMGCFGSPMTTTNKARYTQNHSYNKAADRVAMINAASMDTFGFDCVNFIKGILWGWCGDKTKTYGGARYAVNGVPDIDANTMIGKCKDASATGWDKLDPGEVIWITNHIGVYIGDGLAVECTPKWKNGVQITAVANIGQKTGYNARTWKKHGHLPYVTYDITSTTKVEPEIVTPSAVTEIKASGVAKSFNRSVAGSYSVTASAGLNVRDSAGTGKVLTTIPKGTVVRNYGYYSVVKGVKWLYVQFTYKRITYTGFYSSAYLTKK